MEEDLINYQLETQGGVKSKMDEVRFPTIVSVISEKFGAYTKALTEAQNLAGRDELDADERRRFDELMQHLRKDEATAGLLSSEQRVGLDAVFDAHVQLSNVPFPACISKITQNYVVLNNIRPVDADDTVLWSHPKLYIPKNIIKDANGNHVNKTPYEWAVFFEQQEQNGWFLPSPADTCNILAVLFKNREDKEVRRVFMQYKDQGYGSGLHAQNGLVDFGVRQFIHYPNAADFGKSGSVNAGRRRTALSFDKFVLRSERLEDALRVPEKARYVRQWSCLKDPSVLVEIGEEYGNPARLWFPWNRKNSTGYNKKMLAWVGHIADIFTLYASGNLSFYYATRGVLQAPQARKRKNSST